MALSIRRSRGCALPARERLSPGIVLCSHIRGLSSLPGVRRRMTRGTPPRHQSGTGRDSSNHLQRFLVRVVMRGDRGAGCQPVIPPCLTGARCLLPSLDAAGSGAMGGTPETTLCTPVDEVGLPASSPLALPAGLPPSGEDVILAQLLPILITNRNYIPCLF